jgi:hypothetical protein
MVPAMGRLSQRSQTSPMLSASTSAWSLLKSSGQLSISPQIPSVSSSLSGSKRDRHIITDPS